MASRHLLSADRHHRYLEKIARPRKLVLLFGTKGEGLPCKILYALPTARITTAADFDSLNVATASGIALACFADTVRLNGRPGG